MPRYLTYSSVLRKRFGCRTQLVPIDGGFTCPNRDGSVGTSGCSFCNNDAFCPPYCHATDESMVRRVPPVTTQIDNGIGFFRRRNSQNTCFLAYFQAFSGTHAPVRLLEQLYREAIAHPLISGLVIATRPDCVDEAKLDLLAELAETTPVAIEYGIESCYDRTLARVGRGHDFTTTCQAIRATADRGIHCGGHLILGLPGESREDILAEISEINRLPLSSLKLHQLQILRGAPMAEAWKNGTLEAPAFLLDEYVMLVCDLLERLRPDIAVERLSAQVPSRFQADPSRCWRHADGRPVRSDEIPDLIEQELCLRGSRQGSKYRH